VIVEGESYPLPTVHCVELSKLPLSKPFTPITCVTPLFSSIQIVPIGLVCALTLSTSVAKLNELPPCTQVYRPLSKCYKSFSISLLIIQIFER
jgi:hypothetical protein